MLNRLSFNIDLDINSSTIKKYNFQLAQGDIEAYQFSIKLHTGLNQYDLTGVHHSWIIFKLSNGSVIQGVCDMSTPLTNGELTYDINSNEISCAGIVYTEIELYDEDNSKITSSRFQFEVRKTLNNDSAVQSSTQYSVLIELIDNAEQAVTDANTALLDATDAITNANIAIADAINATTNADEKANLANTATSNANTATTNANNAETTRQTNETGRVDAESARVTAETNRVSSESTRVTFESGRATAETNRANAETIRQGNETTRQSQETTRQTNFNNFGHMGAYSGVTTYLKNNIVSYNGSSYMCTATSVVGVLPTDTSKWQLSAQVGAGGTTTDTEVANTHVEILGESNANLKSRLDKLANILGKITNISVDTSLTHTQSGTVNVTTSTNTIIVTLPVGDATKIGKFIIRKADSALGTVRIIPQGANTIDGQTEILLGSQYNKISILSNGTNWLVDNYDESYSSAMSAVAEVTASVFSLPNTANNGQLSVTVKGNTRNNLIKSSNMNVDTNADGVVDNWNPYNNIGATFALNDNAQKISITNCSTNSNFANVQQGNIGNTVQIPCVAGEVVSVRTEYKFTKTAGSPFVRFMVGFMDSAGSWVVASPNDYHVDVVTGTTGYAELKIENKIVPTGTAYLTIRLYLYTSASASTTPETADVWFKNVMLEKSSSVGNYISSGTKSTLSSRLTAYDLKNETIYTPSTWAEWTKPAGVVGDSTGLEITADGSIYVGATIPTTLKPSTKYGILLYCVSKTLTNGIFFGSVSGADAFSSSEVNNAPINVGNFKLSATTRPDLSVGKNFRVSVKNNEIAGNKIKIKDVRVFELPTGSQIETDFTNLTADQLSTKYPYFSGKYKTYNEAYTPADKKLTKWDSININTGELTTGGKEKVLQASDVYSMRTSDANLDYALILKPTDAIFYNTSPATITSTILDVYIEYSGVSPIDDASNIGKFSVGKSATNIYVGFTKGTTLVQAQTALAGKTLSYQLATEIKTYYPPQVLTVGANYTVIVEPFAQEYKITEGEGILLTNPVKSVESKTQIKANGDKVNINVGDITIHRLNTSTTAEAGTNTTNITKTAHGLSVGDRICNKSRNNSVRKVATVVDANNFTVTAISSQTTGDLIDTFKSSVTDTSKSAVLSLASSISGQEFIIVYEIPSELSTLGTLQYSYSMNLRSVVDENTKIIAQQSVLIRQLILSALQ